MASVDSDFDSRPDRTGPLIWSEDNLLALLTPSILHIFTPTLKGCVEPDQPVKFLKTTTPALVLKEDRPPWNIALGTTDIRHALSALTLDYAAGAWSPTGCTPFRGCMLACLTNRNQVFIYVPTSLGLEKQWKRQIVLDHFVMTHWEATPEIDLDMADKLEMVSVAWSPKILAGQEGSLLTLGNKAGYIMIWSVTNADRIHCVKSWKTWTDSWIVKLSWSPWTLEGKKYVSILAFASADGLINAHKITCDPLDPLGSLKVSDALMSDPPRSAHPCSVLRWQPTRLNNAGEGNILAFNKANRLHIWKPESDTFLSWRRPMAKTIAEISWGTRDNRIYVFFMDGKHDVLRLKSSELTTDDDCTEYISRAVISKCHTQAKTNIEHEEGGDADNAHADDEGGEDETAGASSKSRLQLHIWGGDRSAQSTQLVTVYCVTSPFLMEFQRDRYVSSTVVMTKANGETIDTGVRDLLFKNLTDYIGIPNSVEVMNPSYLLWDLLLYLGESLREHEGSVDVLETLLKSLAPSNKVSKSIASKEAIMDNSVSLESGLRRALFEDVLINSERACVFIWTQLQTLDLSAGSKETLDGRYAAAVMRIKRHNIKCILEGFIKYMEDLPTSDIESESAPQIKDRDQTMLLVLCDSVLLFHHEDKELMSAAEKAYSTLQTRLDNPCDRDDHRTDILRELQKGNTSALSRLGSARESCPACEAEIRLENDERGTCANGHMWQRCSLTLAVISDFYPRTCRGCRRKTLMVPNPKAGATLLSNSKSATWIEAALRANCVCGFCGERYYADQSRKRS